MELQKKWHISNEYPQMYKLNVNSYPIEYL